MVSPITPLGDKVVIKKRQEEEHTLSGIILPESSSTENSQMVGEVVAVGAGRETDSGKVLPVKVSVGQKVLFSWGDKVEIDGEEYYVVGESNILGVINK